MKIIEILIGLLILAYVFWFGSVIFINSSENFNVFSTFLEKHTNKISQISRFEINTGDCVEEVFTGLFLNQLLTGYFCSSGDTFNWFLK